MLSSHCTVYEFYAWIEGADSKLDPICVNCSPLCNDTVFHRPENEMDVLLNETIDSFPKYLGQEWRLLSEKVFCIPPCSRLTASVQDNAIAENRCCAVAISSCEDLILWHKTAGTSLKTSAFSKKNSMTHCVAHCCKIGIKFSINYLRYSS